jgi:hypothetical protein
MVETVESLVSYRHCVNRMCACWPAFLEGRHERLVLVDELLTSLYAPHILTRVRPR